MMGRSRFLTLRQESKLANVLFTKGLSRRLEEEYPTVSTFAVHPGVVATGTMDAIAVRGCLQSVCATYMQHDSLPRAQMFGVMCHAQRES